MANFITRHIRFLSSKLTKEDLEAIARSYASKRAFMDLAMHIAVTYIANAISKCRVRVYVAGEEVADDLSYRLNMSPNPNQSAPQFMAELVRRMCLTGEALAFPFRSKWLYVADSFSVDDRTPNESRYENIAVGTRTLAKSRAASGVFHFALDNESVSKLVGDVMADYGPLMAAAMDGFRKTRGRKYRLSLKGMRAGDPDFMDLYNDVVKGQLDEFMNSDNAVYPQFDGYDLEELKNESMGSSDDVADMRKEIFDVVAQAWKIPSSMMYGNMTNTSDVINQFLTFAVDPVADVISREFTRKSFTQSEWSAGSHVLVDTKSINHVDILDVAEKVDKLISSGVFCIDDLLDLLGYERLGTEFSRAHFMTKNYGLIEDAMSRLDDGR